MFEPDKDTAVYEKFTGLRNTVGPESFEPGDLDAALNVDLTDAQRLRRRKGFSSITAGDYHSLWSNGTTALIVSGSSLYEVLPDLSTRLVRAGLTVAQRMYYWDFGARVFYSNNCETGVFQHGASRSWGIALPTAQATASISGGSLRAGRYQFTTTFIRSDGQESGALGSEVIELISTGGISFSGVPISADPDVIFKRLYISPPNGDKVYLQMVLPNVTTVATYENEVFGTLPLTTQFLSPPPAGKHVGVVGGRTLIARGDRLFYSEPYSPELFDLRRNIPMPSAITLVGPVTNGLYLGCESEIGYLGGLDPSQWEYRRVADFGAIPGTLAYCPADRFVSGAEGITMVVATVTGVCIGQPGGSFQNITHERFNYPVQDEGAGIVRDQGGAIQYIATLRGTQRPGNVAF